MYNTYIFLGYYYCLVHIFMDIILEYENIKLKVNDEIAKKWNNLDEDSKLEYRREARENSENYANLTHNIPCKSRKVSSPTKILECIIMY